MLPPLKLPRLQIRNPITGGRGEPTIEFHRLINSAFERIEQSSNDQQDLLEMLEAQQETLEEQQAALEQVQLQQAQQLLLINEALELAGIAIGLSGGNSGTAFGTYTVDDSTWVEGPQVDLTGVIAGDLTVPSTGLQIIPATRQNTFPTATGQLRVVEIDGVTETVVGGPWVFESTRYDPDPNEPPSTIVNDSAIPSFSASLTTTGALSYRLDAIMDTGFVLTDVRFYIFARRST